MANISSKLPEIKEKYGVGMADLIQFAGGTRIPFSCLPLTFKVLTPPSPRHPYLPAWPCHARLRWPQ